MRNTAVMCSLFALLGGEKRENAASAAAVLALCQRVLNLYPSDLPPILHACPWMKYLYDLNKPRFYSKIVRQNSNEALSG